MFIHYNTKGGCYLIEKLIFIVFILGIAILGGMVYMLNKICKRKNSKKKGLFIIILSVASFLFLFEIVLFTTTPSPKWLSANFPEVLNISEVTSFWAETWLSIASIIVSIITAVIAIFISLKQDTLAQKQDDLAQFSFETTLVPLLKSDGFEFINITNNLYESYGIKHKKPQNKSFHTSNDEAIVLSFELLGNINPNLNYKIESLKIYNGRYDFENIDTFSPIEEFSPDVNGLNLEILQKNSSCAWECLFFFKDRAKCSKDFNDFLFSMTNLNRKNNLSQYTFYLSMSVSSNNPKYGDAKNLELLIRIINEGAFYNTDKKSCSFKIHSTIPMIK